MTAGKCLLNNGSVVKMRRLAMYMLAICATSLAAHADTWTDTSGNVWTYTVESAAATVTAVSSGTTDIAVPATLGGVPATSFGSESFSGCTNLRNVVFPNMTEFIIFGNGAFASGLHVTMEAEEGYAFSRWVDADGNGVNPISFTNDFLSVRAEFTPVVVVKNVSFRQRYPWNGLVDVNFDVDYVDPATNFMIRLSAKDALTGKSLTAKHFWLEGDDTQTNKVTVVAGAGYHILWDVAADYPDVVCQNLQVMVSASLGARNFAVASGENGDVRVYATGTDYYLGNDFFEIGITRYGAFGSSSYDSASTDFVFHPRTYGLSFISLFDYDVLTDFFYPGYENERWLIYENGMYIAEATIGGGSSGIFNSKFLNQSSDTIADVSVVNTCYSDFTVEHNVTFSSDNLGYLMAVRITNTSESDKTNVKYVRRYDPDQASCSWSETWTPSTDNYYYKDDNGNVYVYAFVNNTGVYEDDPESLRAAIVAAGRNPYVMVGVASSEYSIDAISYGSATSRYNWHSYDDDVEMGLQFTIPCIPAGETVELHYIGTIDKYVNLTEDDPFGGYGFASAAAKGVSEEGRLDTTTGNRLAEGEEVFTYNPAWGDGESASVFEDGVEIRNDITAGEFAWTPPTSAGLHELTHVSGDEILSAAFVVWGDDIVSHSANVNSDEIWSADKVHVIRQSVTVADGVTLTIEPGAVVKFMYGTTLTISGGATCIAKGVIFTHINDDTAGGDTMYDGEAKMPIMGDYEIDVQGTIEDDDATEYRYFPPQELTSYIDSDTRLRGHRLYIASYDVTVAPGATLTLLPGTIIKFHSGCTMRVNGTLDAQGTRAAPIVFTSIMDDDHGGDSNDDGDKTAAEGGDWDGIWVYGKAVVNHSKLLYSGNGNERGIIQTSGSGVLAMNGCTIAHAENDGIWNWGGKISVTNTVFVDTGWATAPYNGSRNEFVNCVFYGNDVAMCYWSHWSGRPNYVNCVFAECGNGWCELGSGSYGAPPSAVGVYNCLFWSSEENGGRSCYRVGTVGNISGDPKFLDPDNGDFRIAEDSPCVDAGDGTTAPELDAYGRPRMDVVDVKDAGRAAANGMCPDIGIYEVLGNSPVPAPNLVVSSVDVTNQLTVGDSVVVKWTVRNDGEEPATGVWRDELSLVSGNGQSAVMGVVESRGPIEVGESKEFTATLKVAAVPEGAVQVCATVNKLMDMFEGIHYDDNVGYATAWLDVEEVEFPDGGEVTLALGPGETSGFAVADVTEMGPAVLVIRGAGELNAWLGNGSMAMHDSAVRTAVKVSDDAWVLALPEGTELRVTVANEGLTAATARLSIEKGDFFLFEMDKKAFSNAGVVTVPFAGNGFAAGMACWIEREGNRIDAIDVVVGSEVYAQATFDVTDCALGDYVLHVKKGETEVSATLLALVQGGAGAQWHCHVDVNSTIRTGREYVGVLRYGNSGDAAMPAPYLHLIAEEGTLIRLDKADAWTESIELMAISSTYPASSLKPGEEGRIEFRYKATGSRVSVVCEILPSSSDAFPWDTNAAYMRPSWATDEMWGLALATLKANVGATWDDFLSRMRANCDHLMKLGQSTARLDRLWQMEVNESLGVDHAVSTLASNTDLARSGRGFGLALSRSYGSGLYRRLRKGIFGYGWSDNYSAYAELQNSGATLALHSGSGSTYLFEKVNGKWTPEDARDKTTCMESSTEYVLTYRSGMEQKIAKSNMRVSSVTDNQGNSLTFTYNADNQLVKVEHCDGQSLSFAYANGLLVSATDDQRRTTRYEYSGDLLVKVTAFNGLSTQYRYLPADGTVTSRALSQIAYADGTTRDYTYDGAGRVATVSINGNKQTVEIERGALGSYAVIAPNGGVTTVTLGASGEVLETVNALGQKSTRTYTADTLLESVVGPTGKRAKIAYDEDGQAIKATDAAGAATAFAYTADFGNLSKVTDARGNSFDYGYDKKGRSKSISYADGSIESIAYNDRGDVTNSVNRRGQSIAFTYDREGNTLSKVWEDGRTFTWAYDAKGNCTNATDSATGTVTMEYDENERLVRIVHPKGRGFAYTYDALGRTTSRTTLGGTGSVPSAADIQRYEYDSLGRSWRMTDGDGNLYVENHYDETTGWLITQTYGNGTIVSNAYDILGRTIGIYHGRARSPNGPIETLAFFEYAYDAEGRRISQTSAEGVERYTYDTVGQLTDVTYPDGTEEHFRYDAVGNRVSASGKTYTANNLNQYTAISGVSAMTYDFDGNMTSRTNAGGTMVCDYDIQNRLVAVTDETRGIHWSCEYDVFGNRVSVTDNGKTMEYLFVQGSLPSVVAEYQDDVLITRHILLGSVRLASLTTNHSSLTTKYYHADGIASTRLLTDANGDTIGTVSYRAFGEVRMGGSPSSATATAPSAGWVGTLGVERDDATGLVFMRNRYYDTEQGRFIQMDPIGILGSDFNFYRYCMNNPNTYVDHNGLSGVDGVGCNPGRVPTRVSSGNGPVQPVNGVGAHKPVSIFDEDNKGKNSKKDDGKKEGNEDTGENGEDGGEGIDINASVETRDKVRKVGQVGLGIGVGVGIGYGLYRVGRTIGAFFTGPAAPVLVPASILSPL